MTPPAKIRRRRMPGPRRNAIEAQAAILVRLNDLVAAGAIARIGGRQDGAAWDALVDLFKRSDREIYGMLSRVFGSVVRDVDQDTNRILGVNPESLTQNLAAYRQGYVGLVKRATATQAKKLDRILETNSGLHVRDLTRLIETQTGVDNARAELWARDQTTKLYSRVTRERHESLGIEEYTWTTACDEIVRGDPNGKWPVRNGKGGDHFSLNGRTFRYDQPPIVDHTGRTANPGDDYQCRCIAYPVTAAAKALRG